MKNRLFVYAIVVISTLVACSTGEEIEKLKKQLRNSTMDNDFDGVPNMYDREDSTETNVKVYGNGISVDTDGDGVADYLDKEVYSPYMSKVDSVGIALDSDLDGVPDDLDKEPETPVGSVVNFQGISIAGGQAKIDGLTGVVGGTSSVNVSSVSNNGGLPIIPFKYSFEIEEYALPLIVQVYTYLSVSPSVKLNIVGHADNVGSESANKQLGLNRAKAVKKLLVSMGVDENRLEVSSKGENEPLVSQDNLTMRKLNRRVHFEIIN